MRYTEQIYSKTKKVCWHGSLYPTYKKELSRWGCFYLISDFEYALRYA